MCDRKAARDTSQAEGRGSSGAEKLCAREFARQRRKRNTPSEGLLWSVLRAKQICGLKFRREHPIAGFVVDFACVGERLVVEIDGGYHDQTAEADLRREEILRRLGWTVVRFAAEEVEADAEAVAVAIARKLGLRYEYVPRAGGGAGMASKRAKKGGTSTKARQVNKAPPLAEARPSQREGAEY